MEDPTKSRDALAERSLTLDSDIPRAAQAPSAYFLDLHPVPIVVAFKENDGAL